MTTEETQSEESVDLQIAKHTGRRTAIRAAVVAAGQAKAEGHCLRVEVYDPDGRIIPYYSRNLMADRGAAVITQDWALNEKPGRYRIDVTDVMSRARASSEVTIDPPDVSIGQKR